MKTKTPSKKGKRNSQNRYSRALVSLDRPSEMTGHGGLALLHRLAGRVGFARHVDENVSVLKIHQGYTESDHLFNLVSTLFAGGNRIEDVSVLQADTAYRSLLQAERISDPTTLGDFLRRFKKEDVNDLRQAMFAMQAAAWKKLGRKHRRRASVDLDSTIKEVYGDKKEGTDFSYNKVFGYHPEFLTLAETHEWLDGVNRSGNESSGSSAVALLRANLPRVKEYFSEVCVRGDRAFGKGDIIDCCMEHDVRFCLGWSSHRSWVKDAELLPKSHWLELNRRQHVGQPGKARKRRRKRANVRRQKVKERGYKEKRLKQEWVAELPYPSLWNEHPRKFQRPCRMVVIRKQIEVAGKTGLFDLYDYSFIITDLMDDSLASVVNYYYQRDNQENLIEQGKNGIGAFTMPTGQLLANEVFMLAGMLAHNFKSWLCLLALGKEKVYWEWKRFRFHFVNVLIRVTRGGRRVHQHIVPSPQATRIIDALTTLGGIRC